MNKHLNKSSTSESDLIKQQINNGQSLVSTNDRIALDKYQNIILTERTPQSNSKSKDLSPDEKILRDYLEKGEVIWHTYNKSEALGDMDTDFKLLASIHLLKRANDLNDRINECYEKMKEFDGDPDDHYAQMEFHRKEYNKHRNIVLRDREILKEYEDECNRLTNKMNTFMFIFEEVEESLEEELESEIPWTVKDLRQLRNLLSEVDLEDEMRQKAHELNQQLQKGEQEVYGL